MAGIAGANDLNTDYSQSTFVIEQLIAKINTMTLVKVVGYTNDGGLSPVGFVDVKIMGALMTGDDDPIEHVTLYNIPYFRLQGGSNAVIMDPVIGDIGMCGFCSRDISEIKAKKDYATPGSRRRYDYSDGLYFGGMLNGTPTQFIRFHADGIFLESPQKISMKAPDITIEADNLSIKASTAFTGSIDINGHVGDEKHTHINSGGTGTGGVVS